MVKKFILGIALLGLVGILVGGAVIRTLDKTSQSSEAHSSQGRGRSSQDVQVDEDIRQTGGQRNGQNQAQTSVSGETTASQEVSIDTWITQQGTVTHIDEEMVTLVLADGEELIIEGRAWSFAQEQGFAIQRGDRLELAGFFEEDTFEVGQINNLTTDESVVLREETGRPLWSGRGRRTT